MKKVLLTTLLTMSFNFFASDRISETATHLAKFPVLVHFVAKADALNCDTKQKSEIKDFIGNYLFGEKWELDHLPVARILMTGNPNQFAGDFFTISILLQTARIMQKAQLEGRRDVIDFIQEHKMQIAPMKL